MRLPLLTAALVLGAAPLAAQLPTAPAPTGPRIGILAGLSSATFGGSDASNPSPDRRTGFVGGVYLTAPIAAGFAFRPEVLYAQKGAQDTESGTTVKIKLNYVEVPVLLQYTVPSTSAVRPQLYLGPAVSLKASCSLEASGGSTSCSDAGFDVKTVDVSGVGGAAVAFPLAGQTFSVGARYTLGFTKIPKNDNSDVKNRAISVYGSIELPFLGR